MFRKSHTIGLPMRGLSKEIWIEVFRKEYEFFVSVYIDKPEWKKN